MNRPLLGAAAERSILVDRRADHLLLVVDETVVDELQQLRPSGDGAEVRKELRLLFFDVVAYCVHHPEMAGFKRRGWRTCLDDEVDDEGRRVHQMVTVQVALAQAPSSVREARRLLADVTSRHEVSDITAAMAALALSELVTNAIVHGSPPILLHIAVGDGVLRVEVTDSDPARPCADEAGLDATGGRGLAIVATVVGAWGVEPGRDGGKVIWFTLSL